MGTQKVDIDNQGWTYSSHVVAGDFIYTSICSGYGENVGAATEVALTHLKKYLDHAGASMEDLVKVTVTLKRGEKALGKLPSAISIQTGETFEIKHLSLETFTKCHDAADPMGLVVSRNGVKIGLVTDMGRSTRLAEDRLRACTALIMEFNYDPTMLSEGPYPLDLKRRIHSSEGHLSNEQAGELLETVSHPDLKWVALAHISETNNEAAKALHAAETVLNRCGLKETRIVIGKQDEALPFIEI